MTLTLHISFDPYIHLYTSTFKDTCMFVGYSKLLTYLTIRKTDRRVGIQTLDIQLNGVQSETNDIQFF